MQRAYSALVNFDTLVQQDLLPLQPADLRLALRANFYLLQHRLWQASATASSVSHLGLRLVLDQKAPYRLGAGRVKAGLELLELLPALLPADVQIRALPRIYINQMDGDVMTFEEVGGMACHFMGQ